MLLIALTLLAPAGARAQWSAQASAGAVYDSNLSRAQETVDRRSDRALEAAGQLTRWFDLGDSLSATLTGDMRGQLWDRYAGLNNLALGVSGGLRYKFGLGRDAPWLRVADRIARLQFDDRYRTGWTNVASITLGKRVADRVTLRGDLRYDRRWTDDKDTSLQFDPAVYDVSGRTIGVAAEFTPDDRWRLSAGFALRRGDVTSTSAPGLAVFTASSSIAEDHALGQYAYRLAANTRLFNATASYELNPQTSVNLVFDRAQSSAANNLSYPDWVAHASIIHSYF